MWQASLLSRLVEDKSDCLADIIIIVRTFGLSESRPQPQPRIFANLMGYVALHQVGKPILAEAPLAHTLLLLHILAHNGCGYGFITRL
jgi:hypothetical protein